MEYFLVGWFWGISEEEFSFTYILVGYKTLQSSGWVMKLINLSTIPHVIQFQMVFMMILSDLKPQTWHDYVLVAKRQKQKHVTFYSVS